MAMACHHFVRNSCTRWIGVSSSSSSLSSLPFLCCTRRCYASSNGAEISSSTGHNNNNNNDTKNSKKPALLLWILSLEDGTSSSTSNTAIRSSSNPRHLPRRWPLLVPSTTTSPPVVVERIVRPDNVHSIVDHVDIHYSRMDDDIGGMGESDSGVWFASVGPWDVLDHTRLIQQSIQQIKEHRHGIPFRLYSCGHPNNAVDIDWDAIREEADSSSITLEMSLFAAKAKDYVTCTRPRGTEKDFSQVCGTIASAAEWITVEVGVLKEYEAPAHSLALSLGAQQVHGYAKEDVVTNVVS